MSANLRTPKKIALPLMNTRNSSSDSKKNQFFNNEMEFKKSPMIKVFFPIKNKNSQKENIYLKNLKKTIKKELFEGRQDTFIGNTKDYFPMKSKETSTQNENESTSKILITNNNARDIQFKENKKDFCKDNHQEKEIKNFNINESEISKRVGKYFFNNDVAIILEKFKDKCLFNEKFFKLLIEFMNLEDLCKFHKVCKKFFFSKFKSIIKKRLSELIIKVFKYFFFFLILSFF